MAQPPVTQYIPQQVYEHIPFPTFEELRRAAHVWDQLAELHRLPYALVGSIVARLRGESLGHEFQYQIHTMEILVQPEALANNAAILTALKDQHPEWLGITPTNRHIVVICQNTGKGIALQFIPLGSVGYPNQFIPPYDSPFRTAAHLYLEPTYRHHCLGYLINERTVTCVPSKILLKQRLLYFNASGTGLERRTQRDKNDIKAFIKLTAQDQDQRFQLPELQFLNLKVLHWVIYVRNNSDNVTPDMWTELERLGFNTQWIRSLTG